MVGQKTDVPAPCCAAGPPAPAEDDEVGLLLGGQLDDALGGAAADAHDGAQLDAGWRELEHPLQQPARLPRPRGALRERHALGHLDDAERRERAAVLDQRRADAHQVGGGPRVGERHQDVLRQLAARSARARLRRRCASTGRGGHRAAVARTPFASSLDRVPALDEVRLGQLERARLALDEGLGLVGGQRPWSR